MLRAILNANSIVQHLFQIKNGITKLVNANVKIMVHVKIVIVKILAHTLMGIASI